MLPAWKVCFTVGANGSEVKVMKLTQINGIEKFNTSSVKKMSNMFCRCDKLLNLNVNNFDTSNVTDMNCMFNNCASLQNELDLSKWNIENVTNINSMFFKCGSPEIIMPGYNSKLTNMGAMFQGCQASKIDISGIDTSNVTWMRCIFHGCPNLKYLDISDFSFDNLTEDGSEHFIYWLSRSDAKVYVKDEKAQQWVLNHRSGWTEDNVIIKN